jgi:hypothetical protein
MEAGGARTGQSLAGGGSATCVLGGGTVQFFAHCLFVKNWTVPPALGVTVFEGEGVQRAAALWPPEAQQFVSPTI